MEISANLATPSQGVTAPGVQELPNTTAPQDTKPAETVTPNEGNGEAPAQVTLGDAPAEQPLASDAKPDAPNEFTYEPTGDAGLDYALNFIGQQGFGDQHPAVIAASKGDFSLIEAELAIKNVPGAAQVVALAKQSYERHTAEAAKREAELSSFAATTAGSQQNWALVQAWASAEATPEEKAQVNAALAQGGLVAQGVITQLVNLYTQRHTLPKDAAAVASPNAAVLNGDAGEPMTAQRYAREVEALRMKLGNRTEESPEYAILQNQRLAARRAGI